MYLYAISKKTINYFVLLSFMEKIISNNRCMYRKYQKNIHFILFAS